MSFSLLSMCVGRNVVIGTSDRATTSRRGPRRPCPSPIWQYMRPALPASIPPTRASIAVSMMVSMLGCDPRWSEIAHSPTPMHCSIRHTSRRTLPVIVGEGRRYAPVHMYAVMPSSLSARALMQRFSRLLLTQSVPSTPTTVVIPPSIISCTLPSGVRDAGPSSPPPPVMCTWQSTKPGVMMQLEASTMCVLMSCETASSASAASSSSRPTICVPPTSTCLALMQSGEKMACAFLMSVSLKRDCTGPALVTALGALGSRSDLALSYNTIVESSSFPIAMNVAAIPRRYKRGNTPVSLLPGTKARPAPLRRFQKLCTSSDSFGLCSQQ
mmetsp:Transcript_38394/g.94369  ORF Transcript_38394/g.94369 Transcript_38394/m.94369 type:complete len:327 (-) Transcript_38394:1638-2618(-)